MTYLRDAIKRSLDITSQPTTNSVDETLSPDDIMLHNALKHAKKKFVNEESDGYTKLTADKGMFGGKTLVFKTDVYKLDQSGDISSRAGLVTPKDLESHVRFRKGDMLTFQWNSGEAGASTYTAKGNGQDDFSNEFKWTDKLIGELVDEGSLNEE